VHSFWALKMSFDVDILALFGLVTVLATFSKILVNLFQSSRHPARSGLFLNTHPLIVLLPWRVGAVRILRMLRPYFAKCGLCNSLCSNLRVVTKIIKFKNIISPSI
jgi:hypothetical protein